MEPKTDAQMFLLAGAKTADEEWLYPGLHERADRLAQVQRAAEAAGVYLTNTWLPVFYLEDMISACRSRKDWSLHFWREDEQYHDNVSIGLGDNYAWKRGVDVLDALFQATAADPPPNWERCGTSMHLNEGQDGDCPFCSGTGFILRSEGGQDG